MDVESNTHTKIEAFEMWILRRMLKAPWVDHVRNEDILRRAGIADRELFKNIQKRKIGYLGHILHGERDHFQRLILQSKIEEERRGIGRKKLSSLSCSAYSLRILAIIPAMTTLLTAAVFKPRDFSPSWFSFPVHFSLNNGY